MSGERPAPPRPPAARRRPRGLWSEAPVVLPGALLLFALLGLATLLSYRAAVGRFALERENEALALATRFAETLAAGGERTLERPLRALPPGSALALLDASGRRLASAGPPEALERGSAAIDAARGRAPVALGPEATGFAAVVAIVPFRRDGESLLLRLDLPARTLAVERRTLAVWTPLALALGVAAALVATLFFRALARPYEALLARARAATGETGGEERGDELDQLLETFDRALAALGAPAGELAPLAGALGRTLDGGFLLLDAAGRLLVATPAAAELLGPATPAPGAPLAGALAGPAGEGDALARALAAGAPLPRSTLRLRSAEGERALGLALEPLRGEGGRLRGFLVIVADVSASERAEARERLAEGLAQLGELSAGVAHELRNGLAALAGWIQLLRRRPLEGEAADCAREVERETRQLARVVDDFLAFARPGTRRLEPVDLGALLRRVAQAPARGGVRVALQLAAEPAPLAGDALLLERALGNLLENAAAANLDAAAGGEPAAIELALERAGDAFEIAISDRGPGVPAAVRARLFEPFVSGRPGGVGLGLALARRVVLLHGGEIEAVDRPGGGTLVRLRLPSDSSATESSDAAS